MPKPHVNQQPMSTHPGAQRRREILESIILHHRVAHEPYLTGSGSLLYPACLRQETAGLLNLAQDLARLLYAGIAGILANRLFEVLTRRLLITLSMIGHAQMISENGYLR
mgnify:FL=1